MAHHRYVSVTAVVSVLFRLLSFGTLITGHQALLVSSETYFLVTASFGIDDLDPYLQTHRN